jgi:hypothetical protein
LNFFDRFTKTLQISNLMKIRPVGAELFHADGRMDMTKLTVALRNFANAPKTRMTPVNLFNNTKEIVSFLDVKRAIVTALYK